MVVRSLHVEPDDETDLIALVLVSAGDNYGPALVRKMLGCFFANAGRGTDDQTGSLLSHEALCADCGGARETKELASHMRGSMII